MPLDEPITMPDFEHEQVEELGKLLQLGSPELVGPYGAERIPLPHSLFQLLKRAVSLLQKGRAIALVPQDEELTTQTAANFLGVSRPHLIKLLESREISFHKVGSHRRILFSDIFAYAKKKDAKRRTILNALAQEAFEGGLYDQISIPVGGEDE